MTTVNPDRSCPHENLTANVEVNRLTSEAEPGVIVGYSANITVWCTICGPDFGLGIPGFSIVRRD